MVQDLEQDGTASFHFIHGEIEAPPPNGFKEFYGLPPHRRFFPDIYRGIKDDEVFNATLIAPETSTPEQKSREVAHSLGSKRTESFQNTIDRLYRILENDGPFDGIIGNSEGATVAATFIVDYLRRCARKEVDDSLKCAVFMSGSPPVSSDGSGLLLADEYGQMITMPTCHIIGYNDSIIEGAIALYHLCDEASATMVDHGRGHLVPRDPFSSKLIIQGIRDLIARVKKSSSSE